jgi:aspartate/methionine/tyrosine aminotransferase
MRVLTLPLLLLTHLHNDIPLHTLQSYGMAGWRVGYMIYPQRLSADMQKIQDAIPTHPSIASQKLAIAALKSDSSWVHNQVQSLAVCREAMWHAVKDCGTVRTCGAFYYLVPLPRGIDELYAIDVLAREFGVLVTPGYAFGAPQHVRVSYGSLPQAQCLQAIERFGAGVKELQRRAADGSSGASSHSNSSITNS